MFDVLCFFSDKSSSFAVAELYTAPNLSVSLHDKLCPVDSQEVWYSNCANTCYHLLCFKFIKHDRKQEHKEKTKGISTNAYLFNYLKEILTILSNGHASVLERWHGTNT